MIERAYIVGVIGEPGAGAISVRRKKGIDISVRHDWHALVDELKVAIVELFILILLDPRKHSERPGGIDAL